MNKQEKDTALADLAKAYRLLEKNKPAEARNLLDHLTALPVDSADLHLGIGNLCLHLKENALAIEHLAQALALEPDNPSILAQLAGAYTATRQFGQAENLLLRAIDKHPAHLDAMNALSTLYILNGNLDLARNWSEKVIAIKSQDATAHRNLSHVLSLTGDPEQALEHAEIARRLSPKVIQNYFNTSGILIHLGRHDEAVRQIEKALKIDPLCGAAYELLSSIKKWRREDLPFITATEARLQEEMDILSRANFHFALGKMYDDIGEYQQAFIHFQKGNTYGKPALKKALDNAVVRNQKALCTKKYLASIPHEGTSDIPVFIVGMPRSGTSLIEQIIASHPLAEGAGEVTEMGEIANALFGRNEYRHGLLGSRMPDTRTLHEHAGRYLHVLCKNRESAQRITDKMPENFNLLGTIAMLFPRARIIHAVRHPLDTCLSCYFQMFSHVSWSYDLEWIASTYRYYRKSMAHWQKTLPAGMMIDVHYEQLVEQPEQESRRILAHCGLEWDPACLAFFNTRREVRTSSAWQVRQPIYQSSRNRWVHYAPFVGELANEIAEFLQDDRDALQAHGITLKKPGLLRRVHP